MTLDDAPAPRTRARRAGAPSWFVRVTSIVLGGGNLGWLIYLLLIRVDVLRRSPVWDGALAVVPWHSPIALGLALGLSGLLILAGQLPIRTHTLSVLGHAVGAATWGLLCGSWIYAAVIGQGLGGGNAVLAAQLLVLHGVFAYLRRH